MFVLSAVADDCLQYKKMPRILLNTPDWTKQVVQPSESLDLWHGNVVATLVDKYEILTDVKQVDNGYCVILNTVDAIVGYSDFLVQIDISHVPDSCEYNAILKHENSHVKTYLSVIDDYKKDLQKAIFSASDSIMPVFVKSKDDIDLVVEDINNKIQSHPDLMLIKQKIKADEEIKNKQIDRHESNKDLEKCSKK